MPVSIFLARVVAGALGQEVDVHMKQEWYDYGDFFAVALDEIGIFGLGAVSRSRGLFQLCIWVNGRHKMFLAANYSKKTDVQTILGKLDGKVLVYVQEKTWRADLVELGSGRHPAQFDNFRLTRHSRNEEEKEV